ncbi:MAG: hypothetical protein ABI551_20035, partial [Polyangiaceae bacterium]
MAVIPAALDSDVEDVRWALQTAEALWRRDERVDAIVWLRRAAQAAGEEGDDDRALFLARHAAELSEWLAHNQGEDPPLPSGAPPPESEASKSSLGPVDDLLAAPSVPAQAALPQFDEGTGELEPAVSLSAPPDVQEEAPSAQEAHKGMFDPWSEQAAAEDGALHRSKNDVPAPAQPVTSAAAEKENFEDDEIVTSASFVAADPVSAPPVPKKPMPPKPAVRTPEDDDQVLEGIGMAAALKEMRDSQRAPRLRSQPDEDEVTAKPPVVAAPPPLPKVAPPVPPRAKPPLPKPGPPRPPLPKLAPPKPHAPRAPAPPAFVPEEAPTLAREEHEEHDENEPQTTEPPNVEPVTPKKAASEPPKAAPAAPALEPAPAEPEPAAAYAHPLEGPL